MKKPIRIIDKNTWLSAILFGLLSISLLTPIGSFFGTYDYLPDNDWQAHNALVIQANMAIDEGQFPIRVAPWEHEGLRYGTFQFYGVLPFMVTGYLYHFLNQTHHAIFQNPFNILKFVVWLSLILGGVFAYRFAKLFTKSDALAFLAAVVYLFSPYLSINININGAFTEVIAQGVLPVALYFGFKILQDKQIRLTDCIFSTIAWFVILTSHIITFAYGALVFLLAVFIFLCVRYINIKQFCCVVFSVAYAWLLAAWYIVPIVLLSPKLAASGFVGPYGDIGLKPTSIFNLLALRSGGTDVSPSWPGFYTAIGWPCLFGFLACLYYLFWPKTLRYTRNYYLMAVITALFAITIFMTWSWINIWRFLPYYFSIGQYGHRFIAQLMWLGIILFVLAAEYIFGDQLDARHFVLGIFLICLSSASWLVKPPDGLLVSSLIHQPEISRGAADYLMRPAILPYSSQLQKEYGFIQLPLVTIDSQLILDRPVNLDQQTIASNSVFVLKGVIDSKASPGDLIVKLNDKIIGTKSINPGMAIDWRIPIDSAASTLVIDEIVKEKQTSEKPLIKLLPMRVQKLEIVNPINIPIVPMEAVKPFCAKHQNILNCRVDVTLPKVIMQLPELYYPNVLTVLIDGKPVRYDATYFQYLAAIQKQLGYDTLHSPTPLTAVSIVVPAGVHAVTAKFTGIAWANRVSILSWLLLVVTAIYVMFYKK